MTSPPPSGTRIGTISRRGMLWLAGSAIAPVMATPWEGAARQSLSALTAELGLAGTEAQHLVERVVAAVGPRRLAAHFHALNRRMESCQYAEGEMADMLRMWSRDDFVQERTVVVEGIQFSHTELALFELVRRG